MLTFLKKIFHRLMGKPVKFDSANFFCNFTERHLQTFQSISNFKEIMYLDDGLILKEGPAINAESPNDVGLYVVK